MRLPRLVFRAIERSDELLVLVVQAGAHGPTVIGSNEAFQRASGFGREALEGMALAVLAAPAADREILARLGDWLADGGSGRVQLLCRRAEGAPFAFDAEAVHAGDRTEERGLVLLGRDGTAQLRASDQQKATQALFATVFMSVPIPVAVVGTDGRFQLTNPALDRLVGYGASELVGKATIDLVAPASHEAVIASRERQIAEGGDSSLAIQALRRDGSCFDAEISSVIVRGAGPQRVRVMTVRELGSKTSLPSRMQVAGKVKLVGLATVRAELGDRWPALAGRALATAEHVIRKRLSPADTFAPTDDDGFLICFATANEDEAAFRAAVISREIRQRLIGESDQPDASQVTAITAQVPVAIDQEKPPAVLEAHLAARLEERTAELQAKARSVLADAIGKARCEAEPVHGRSGRHVIGALVGLTASVGIRLHAAAAALPADEVMDLDLDAFLLRLADGHARTEALHGIANPMLVAVSFDPFLTRARTERYLAACRTLSPEVQKRLILLLSHLPAGIPESRVLDCLQRLRPFCRTVGFEIMDLEMPRIGPIGSGTIISIAATASPVLVAPGGAQLVGFLARLHARKCKLLVRGVRGWAEAERLRGLGVDLVSVDAGPEP